MQLLCRGHADRMPVMIHDVAIIGSGMAGLTCARQLADAGLSVLVLDKGRRIGGRMATRRVVNNEVELHFDYGAQYFSVNESGFRASLEKWPNGISLWNDGGQQPHLVGLPGMSELPRLMAQGLDVRQDVEVTALSRFAQGWNIVAEGVTLKARHVVVTIPAPQVAQLLGQDHPLVHSLSSVIMAPCLTLMAAFPIGSPRPFANKKSGVDPLSWIACDSSKPDRPETAVTWVAQAAPVWSARHLEAEKEALASLMLPMLCEVIGTLPYQALYVSTHRWRYARAAVPLGLPFLRSDCGSLHLGGDWCLGPRVECAWQSGDAVARDILERRHVG